MLYCTMLRFVIMMSLNEDTYIGLHTYFFQMTRPPSPSFREMAAQADFSLFKTLISNPNHVLRSLCTLRPTIQYHLRPRPHPFNLPLRDIRNFLSRLMFLGTY